MGIPVYEQFPGGFPGGMTKGLSAATTAADTGGNAALWWPAPRQPLRRGEACPFGCGRNLRDRTPGSTTTGTDYPSHRTNGPVGRRLNMQHSGSAYKNEPLQAARQSFRSRKERRRRAAVPRSRSTPLDSPRVDPPRRATLDPTPEESMLMQRPLFMEEEEGAQHRQEVGRRRNRKWIEQLRGERQAERRVRLAVDLLKRHVCTTLYILYRESLRKYTGWCSNDCNVYA